MAPSPGPTNSIPVRSSIASGAATTAANTTVSPAIRSRTTPLPGSSPHDLRSAGSSRFASPQSTASPSNIGWAPRSTEKRQSPAPRGRDTTSPGTRQARTASWRGSVPETPTPTRGLGIRITEDWIIDPGRLKHRLEYVMKKHPELTEEDRLHIQVATENRWLDSSSREPVLVLMLLRRGSTLLDAIERLTCDEPLVLQAFADYGHSYLSKPLLWLSVEGESVRGSCDGALQ